MSRLQKVLLASLLAMFLCHPALANTSDQEMLALGKQHLQNHKYSFAITWFERLLRTYPSSSHKKEVLLLMAQGYLATDREEKAADALQKLVKQYPEEAAKLPPRQLELAKRPPRPQAVEQQPAAPSIVISGGLMDDKPKPIPIIDPPAENPGGPEGQQVLSDGTNIYATSAVADNAVDISETLRKSDAAAPVMEHPATIATGSPAPAAAAASAAPVKVTLPKTDAASSTLKPAAADNKAAVATPSIAPSTTPPAMPSPTKPSAAASSAAASSAAASSAAASSAAAPSAAAPSAAAPSAAVAPLVALQSAKTVTATARVLPRAVAPAKPAAPKPAAKAVTIDEKGTFTLKIGEYLLPPDVNEVKKKVAKAGVSPQVIEGRKKMPVVRLEVEGVTDQESARKKLEDVRKASGTGIIMVSKEGKRRLYAGSYLNQKVAEQEQQRLAALGIKSSLQKAVAPVATYSVTAGPFATREAALEQERKLAKEGVQAVLVQIGK